jgi:cellulose synthase/poly-beta-1,6-N-acetylglucosamine synthase-like glycosyltransferase
MIQLTTKKSPNKNKEPQKRYNFQSPAKGWIAAIMGSIIIIVAVLWAKSYIAITLANVINVLAVLSIVAFVFLIVKMMFFFIFSYKHYKKTSKPLRLNLNGPMVTAILPCYNEGLVLENAAKSMMGQSYHNLEILIVNDGSTDNTSEIGKRLAAKYGPKLKFLEKPNGGKASALNLGIQHAKGEIVICMDSDSVFSKNAVAHLASTFQDPAVVGAAGNVKVSNSCNFWTRSQRVEWATGLSMQERAFAELGCMQVITGAVGAFRKSALLAVGGYSSDTIVEDMDITVTLQRIKGAKVQFNPWAVAKTEAPESYKDFYKQRYRWTYGRYQILKKHRDMLFNPEYGMMGMFGLPYYLLTPLLNIGTAILFVFVLILAVVTNSLTIALVYIGIAAIVTILLGIYAVYIDNNHDNYKLSLYGVIQNMWYMFIISYIDTKAWFDHAIGKKTKWNKVARYGKNTITAGN